MKQIVKMAMLTGMLEKTFNLINADWFDGKLETPIITIIPTTRSYAHVSTANIWRVENGGRRELNLGAGTLDRPIEDIVGSIAHAAVHLLNDQVLNIQDCSRGGQYHNRYFAIEAEKHGLIVEKHPKWGWAITHPDDDLIEWVLNHDELREIEICRANSAYTAIDIGGKAASGGVPASTSTNSHSRKYICAKCGNSVQATKTVNIICGDCMERMQEA